VRVLDQFSELVGLIASEIEERRAQRAAIVMNTAVALRDSTFGEHALRAVKLGVLARKTVTPIKVEPDQSYVNLGVKWNGLGVLIRKPRRGSEIKAKTLYGVRPGQLVYNRMFVVEGSFALVPPECEDAVISSEFPVFDIDETAVEPEWLLQYLCDPYTLARIEAEVTGTERGSMKSRRRWNQDQFARFDVELPTLERQREIVRVLRSSDNLIESLNAELAARRKQYEYYCDSLLTFEEAPA
jgi:type I restriction enzyme S subunit